MRDLFRTPDRLAVWMLAIGVAGLTLLGLGDRLGLDGRVGWVLDLLSHWPKHLFLVAVLVAAIAGWRRYLATAGVAAAVAAINGALVLGVGGYAVPEAAPADARLVRVVSFNAHGSEEAVARVAEMARAYEADIVSLYEVPDDLTPEDVARLFPQLPVVSLPSARANGWPLIRRSLLVARDARVGGVAMFDGSHGVLIHGETNGVQLTTTHPPSPGDPGLKRDRDQQLGAIAGLIDTEQPFIVMGDFNSTPWGRAYGLAPGTRAGDPRFEGTFPTGAGWFGLPIDHIRFGGLMLTDYRVGPDAGSDHLPLFATFTLPDR